MFFHKTPTASGILGSCRPPSLCLPFFLEVNTPEMKIVGECLSFLKSFEFLSLLEHLTGIDLLKNSDFISDENHHNEGSDGDENSDAQSDEEADEDSDYLSLQSEVRWWKSGDYTLLQDKVRVENQYLKIS